MLLLIVLLLRITDLRVIVKKKKKMKSVVAEYIWIGFQGMVIGMQGCFFFNTWYDES